MESGILRIEYSLDNGQTVQTYTEPFTVSTPGKTTIQVKAIDKSGNEEIPQTITIEIAIPPSPTPSISSNNSSGDTSTQTSDTTIPVTTPSKTSIQSISSPPGVLGIDFENPGHISDEINVSGILDELKNPEVKKITTDPAKQILGGLLMVSGGIVTLASLGFALTFIHPTPK